MQCDVCGKHLRLNFKEVRVDTLHKEYFCRNSHKTIYRRYGKTIEINGRKVQVSESFDLARAVGLETTKKLLNDYRAEKNRH